MNGDTPSKGGRELVALKLVPDVPAVLEAAG